MYASSSPNCSMMGANPQPSCVSPTIFFHLRWSNTIKIVVCSDVHIGRSTKTSNLYIHYIVECAFSNNWVSWSRVNNYLRTSVDWSSISTLKLDRIFGETKWVRLRMSKRDISYTWCLQFHSRQIHWIHLLLECNWV